MNKFTVFLLFFFYLVTSYFPPAFAQTTANCSTTGTPVAEGLITAPNLSNPLVNKEGVCIVNDPKTAFAPYKVPTYDSLKSLYFNQVKSTSRVLKHASLEGNFTLTSNDLSMSLNTHHLFHITSLSKDYVIIGLV